MSFIASLVKQADSQPTESSRKELEGIMSRIYDESPWKWPYGLSINAHDEIYMIREASTKEPVGFTGWQERMDGMDKVGYYTVGMLPSHRGLGMAKEAVSKLIIKKAATVDRVQALIAHGNNESVGLAKALGVEHTLLEKKASAGKYLASALLGGAGNAVFWDQVQHPEQPLINSLDPRTYDKSRGLLFALNAVLGSAGALGIHKGVDTFRQPGISAGEAVGAAAAVTGGIGTIALSPAKDLVMKTMPVPDKIRESLAILDAKNQEPVKNNDLSTGQKVGIGAALAAALGVGAYGVNRLADSVDHQTENGQKARVKVTLPTREDTDHETVIDAPVSDFGFSARIYNDLARDTKRRLRGELNERKMRRPKKALPTTSDEELDKEAAQAIQEATQAPSRTPWAANYTAQQMPAPAPEADLVKQVEDAHTKIEQLSQRLKTQETTPVPSATPTQNNFPSLAAVNSRINTALKLIGSTSKSAAALPAKAQGLGEPPKKMPLTVGQLQTAGDLGNRTFMGKPGIQTPFVPYTVPFGQTAYQLGSAAKRVAFGSPQPSAAAQFMEATPPSESYGQQISALVPSILQSIS